MKPHLKTKIPLGDGSRILVLGGGPAGAFFAHHVLREAQRTEKKLRVTIVDPGVFLSPDGRVQTFRECNSCAGLISPRLHSQLNGAGIFLPEPVVCQEFSHIWIHGLWKNFPFKAPDHARVVSVFRGGLPVTRQACIQGFDPFLLQTATDLGARLLTARATGLRYNSRGRPCATLRPDTGTPYEMAGDFACICPGINGTDNGLLTDFGALHPGFVPVRTRPALIFELRPGRGFLKKYMDRELYLIVAGSDRLDLDHAALIPKRDFLTVALTGKSIDRANLPEEAMELVQDFLALPGVRTILPRINLKNTPVSCTCAPLMAVWPARRPYGHRMGLAGDAMGSRLYRDGLYSAFTITRSLARTVIHEGVDRDSLAPAYDEAHAWLKEDNLYGRRLMGLVQTGLKSPWLSRVLYQTFATEMKFKPMDQWSMGKLLWEVGAGTGDYREIFNGLISGAVFRSLLRGCIKTLRNRLAEAFFGLAWEGWGRQAKARAESPGLAVGRYPTVVLKEKRTYFKAAISGPLGFDLDPSPEMERIYAIKVRAPARIIFRELGRFGTQNSKFLKLRFVDVRRVSGTANQAGAVVRYSASGLPIAMDILLKQIIEDKALFYEPSELFCRKGKLIFDISPTRDGNNRLVIYTAFDFKRGQTLGAKIFWKIFRRVFPDWAHDVVWNHAICTIKAEAEKKAA